MNFQTWLDQKKVLYERLLGPAGLFVVQNMLEEAYDAGRSDAQVYDRSPPPYVPTPMYGEVVMGNPGCAIDAFYRSNPDYQGALGLYCSCPKCSARC